MRYQSFLPTMLLLIILAVGCRDDEQVGTAPEQPAEARIGGGRASGPPPLLDPQRLHEQWQERFGLEDCVWPTYEVRAESEIRIAPTQFGSLREAVEQASRDDSVCGPTISVRPGRYDEGIIELTKPTIIDGAGGVTVIGTFANTGPYPLWVQNLAVEQAPFPGAVVLSHPEADATLINLAIKGASGFGILHNGGRLEVWNSVIDQTNLPERWEVPGWFDQIPRSERPEDRSLLVGRTRLGDRTVGKFARRDRMGPGIRGITENIKVSPVKYLPIDLFPLQGCFGTGLYVSGGAYAELSGLVVSFNSRAGLVVRGASTWTTTEGITAVSNGFQQTIDNALNAVESDSCFGGIDVDDGLLLAGAGPSEVSTNAHFGVLARRSAVVGFAGLKAIGNMVGPGSADLGTNVVVYKSFAALSENFELKSAQLAGLNLVESSCNAVDGEITLNHFGVAAQSGSSLYKKNLVVTQNVSNFAGDLLVVDAPAPVPTAP